MPKNYWDFAPPCFRKKVRMFKHQFNFLLLWDIQQCVEGQVLIFSIQIGELCWLLSFVSQFQIHPYLFFDFGAGTLPKPHFSFASWFPLRLCQ